MLFKSFNIWSPCPQQVYYSWLISQKYYFKFYNILIDEKRAEFQNNLVLGKQNENIQVLDRASNSSMLARACSENRCSNSIDAWKIDARSNIVLDWASIYSLFTRFCSENWCSNSLDAGKIDARSNISILHFLPF